MLIMGGRSVTYDPVSDFLDSPQRHKDHKGFTEISSEKLVFYLCVPFVRSVPLW